MTKYQVKATRACLQMTEKEFAKLLNVDPRTVKRWENGEAECSGTAHAVLTALHETLSNVCEGREQKVVDWIKISPKLLVYLMF